MSATLQSIVTSTRWSSLREHIACTDHLTQSHFFFRPRSAFYSIPRINMSSPTPTASSAASSANPSPFPSRYEIRQLSLADLEAANALLMHSNIFHSPVWSVVYKKDVKLALAMARDGSYLTQHQIESGLSYGVFDMQHQYKRPESAATNGKVYWDCGNAATDPAAPLEQIDSPLVSIAKSFDQFYPLDMQKMTPMMQMLPLFGAVYQTLAEADKRNPSDWSATAPGQVLMRNGTSTRADYEGQGLMTKMAQWLMREAKLKGFRGIQIECLHEAVTKAWLHPPAPFTANVITSFDTAEYEEDGPNAEKIKPFTPAKVIIRRVYVTL